MALDPDDLKKLLRERRTDIFDRMEIKKIPEEQKIRREIRSPDGKLVFAEERIVKINPYTGQQEETVVFTSLQCESCRLPITMENLVMGKVKLCVKCGRLVCTCGIKIDDAVLCTLCYERSLCHSCGKPKPQILICENCGERICMDCSAIYKTFWTKPKRVCWNCFHALKR